MKWTTQMKWQTKTKQHIYVFDNLSVVEVIVVLVCQMIRICVTSTSKKFETRMKRSEFRWEKAALGNGLGHSIQSLRTLRHIRIWSDSTSTHSHNQIYGVLHASVVIIIRSIETVRLNGFGACVAGVNCILVIRSPKLATTTNIMTDNAECDFDWWLFGCVAVVVGFEITLRAKSMRECRCRQCRATNLKWIQRSVWRNHHTSFIPYTSNTWNVNCDNFSFHSIHWT